VNFHKFFQSNGAKKLLEKRKPIPPAEVDVYKNEQLESALKNGKLDKYKVCFCFLNFILCWKYFLNKFELKKTI
jgi:hypothetical protein